MSDKKVVYQANVVALPPLKMVLGEVPSPNPKRDGNRTGCEIREPGIEMDGLISHLKDQHK
jgi:hypothetical protein